MAVQPDTLRLAGAIRVTLDRTVDQATADLVKAWARAWRVAVTDWQAAAQALADMAARDGVWPSVGVIAREERAHRALTVTRALLDDLARQAGVTVTKAANSALDQALAGRHDLAGSQLPAALQADFIAALTSPNAGQIAAIVSRSTERITSTLRPLSADSTQAVLDQLVRGVQQGSNPNVVARRIVQQVEGAFNGGLDRATVIARTEILDAYRTSSAFWDRENTDVITGWVWLASLDDRTCPSCWAMHGSEHPVDENGPDDHQQGRCTRLPIVKPWRDLGIAIEEPDSALPDAEAVFNRLPADKQLAIMGPTRLQLLRSGEARWADLSTQRAGAGWRRSFAPTPVRDLPGGGGLAQVA